MKLLNLQKMTTEQKLGMTYCARPGCQEDYDFVFEQIKKRALGCVQVSPKRPDRVKQILELADYPILIICDCENGYPTSDLPKISHNANVYLRQDDIPNFLYFFFNNFRNCLKDKVNDGCN